MEGQGRTLEEMFVHCLMLRSCVSTNPHSSDTMYVTGVKPWKSAEWVAPSPDEIAKIQKEAHGEAGEFHEDKQSHAPTPSI